MSNTDFFDDDLIRQRDHAQRIKLGPGDEPPGGDPEPKSSKDIPSRPVSDLNLTRMARHKQEVDEQASRALQELELLKKRQEEVEREKRELEDFRRKHEEFEHGKREMTGHLKRSIGMLERQELDYQRLTELVTNTRSRFREMLRDIDELKEENWPEDAIQDELARSLGVIEDSRMEYNKAMTKIDAIRTDSPRQETDDASGPVLFEETTPAFEMEKPFSHWVKIGFGVSLPLIATLLILAILYYAIASSGLI